MARNESRCRYLRDELTKRSIRLSRMVTDLNQMLSESNLTIDTMSTLCAGTSLLRSSSVMSQTKACTCWGSYNGCACRVRVAHSTCILELRSQLKALGFKAFALKRLGGATYGSITWLCLHRSFGGRDQVPRKKVEAIHFLRRFWTVIASSKLSHTTQRH